MLLMMDLDTVSGGEGGRSAGTYIYISYSYMCMNSCMDSYIPIMYVLYVLYSDNVIDNVIYNITGK